MEDKNGKEIGLGDFVRARLLGYDYAKTGSITKLDETRDLVQLKLAAEFSDDLHVKFRWVQPVDVVIIRKAGDGELCVGIS
jgi:hypothetical protein